MEGQDFPDLHGLFISEERSQSGRKAGGRDRTFSKTPGGSGSEQKVSLEGFWQLLTKLQTEAFSLLSQQVSD